MSNIESTLTDSQIDTSIYEIDAVMNGGVDPGVEVPQFFDSHMVEMRAIIRKLITSAAK